MSVDAVLFDRNTEHLGSRSTVDVLALCKNLLPPFFSGKPCNNTSFDGGEVSNDEFAVTLGNECGADQLGQGIRHIFVEHFHSLEVTAANKPTGFCQILQVVLGQILHLNDAACPSACAVSTVKLEHTSGTAIGANRSLHYLVLLYRRLGKLLTESQNLLQFRRCRLQHFSHSLFAEGIGFHTVVRKPLLHLLHGIGVVQSGQIFHCLGQLGAGSAVHLNGLPNQFHIQGNTTVIDLLVDVVFVPHAVRHGIFGQARLNGHFGLHIADVVFLESQPLVRGMSRKVAGTLSVGLGRRTGLTEIFDEVFAFGQFLLFKPKYRTDTFQRKRQPHCCSPHHRTLPGIRLQVVASGIAQMP